MENIYEEISDECDYCGRSYYEYDTGYAEYECELTGYPCMGGYIDSGCPLAFRYIVEK